MGRELVTLPLNQLKPSAVNVRKTDPLKDIAELAASIQSKGLLQNLVVRKGPSNGAEPGYEVLAGGRRLAALKLLAKGKKIEKDHPVACRIVNGNDGADLVEVSLAENIVRAPMHPADQFDAFAELQRKGLSADDIAARFGITSVVVVQRLKLAAVSPRLIAEYRTGGMTLEQLMAFTICDDPKAQEEFWFESPPFDRSPETIRRYLTRSQVAGTDRRARFVGTKAYEAAGGSIVRDLFVSEGNGFFADSQLLDRLVVEKLNAEADTVRAEGWGWVEVQVVPDYTYLAKFGRVKPIDVKLSKREERQITKLCERYDELVSEMEDSADEGSSAELNQVSAELNALRLKKERWPDNGKQGAGALVSLEYDGALRVDRGLVRKSETDTETGARKKPKAPADGHSEKLLVELSAERTAALREVLASRSQDALTALLYNLVSAVFFGGSSSCLEIGARSNDLSRFSKTVGQSKAAAALLVRHDRWQGVLPTDDGLWQWLAEADAETRLDLLAYCVATTVDAVYRRGESARLVHADVIAKAVGLDMADWWQPTGAGYFDHIAMEKIVGAVAEACSAEAAHRLRGLKKREMSEAAQAMVAETRWLPDPLRIISEEPKEKDAE